MADYNLSHKFKGDRLVIELLEASDQGDYITGSIEIKRDEFRAWLEGKEQTDGRSDGTNLKPAGRTTRRT